MTVGEDDRIAYASSTQRQVRAVLADALIAARLWRHGQLLAFLSP
jgi:CII-binding regulator of phage lambda lysogenization HflD